MEDGKLTFKEKLKIDVERAKDGLGCAFVLGSLYLGLTIAVNLVALPVAIGFNGLERLVGAEKKQSTVTLVDKGSTNLYNGGPVYWGTFEEENGKRTTLYDGIDILSGKLFSNTKIPRAKVGKSYELTSLEGPISNTVIDLDSK